MIGSRLSRQVQTPPRWLFMTVVIAAVMAVGCEQSAPVNSGGSPGTSNPDLSTDDGGDAAGKTKAKVPDEIPVVTPTPELAKQPEKPDPAGDSGRPQPPAKPDEPVGEKPGNPAGQVNSPPPVNPEKPADPETTAAALLELSQEFLEVKDTKQARFWLEHITKEFPKTKAAARAAALLKSLAG